ncbi:hypothetical protein evm_003270 [Chilo suppressalis]|nr:hypothetical protein evm_003270 [Chilo suppressalis]
MENRIVHLDPRLLKVAPKKTASDAEQISKLRPSQSPIAISLQRCPTWSSLDRLQFKGYWDNQVNGILLNNGQTAYFTFESDTKPTLRGGPLIGEYIFEQMHFHWSVDDFTGCEHVLDGHGGKIVILEHEYFGSFWETRVVSEKYSEHLPNILELANQ